MAQPPLPPALERHGSLLQGRMVPADALSLAMQCAVCFDVITEAATTRCGHSFCRRCILECLNVKHVCPACNQACEPDDLVHNVVLDAAVDALFAAATKADEDLSQSLFAAAAAAPSVPAASHVHEVFAKHLRRSLVGFNQYFERLQANHRTQLQHLQRAFAFHTDSPEGAAEFARARQELIAHHDSAVQLVLDELESHLQAVALPPFLLPTTATIVVNRRQGGGSGGGVGGKPDVRFSMRVEGTTTAAHVVDATKRHFAKQGDDVLAVGEGAVVRLRRKAATSRADEDTITLALDSMQSLFNAVPGNRLDGGSWEVWLEATGLTTRSDVALCFSLEFNKDSPQPVNYFQCDTCKLKWVCARCAVACHAGHEVRVYLENHKPTWACCYCAKKKKTTGCKLCTPPGTLPC